MNFSESSEANAYNIKTQKPGDVVLFWMNLTRKVNVDERTDIFL
jgi:hypothetical protein